MTKFSLHNQNGKSEDHDVLSYTHQNPNDLNNDVQSISDMNGKSQQESEKYSIINQNGFSFETAIHKPKVAFVCTHNSCRSQMAEALCRKYAGDVFESYSAGTDIADKVNPDAVRIMMQLYHIDMQTQRPKLLKELPPVDIVITMGCGVQCPFLPCSRREDWGLDDPTGKGDIALKKTAKEIETKIQSLKESVIHNSR